ncbi:glycoside hydrolase family 73 protein [Paenibacillus sp. GCM10027627]|uniref:glycoside hydrolase family 73 protein n=1 Tax=unclassified Paenibacillus TaxID=185978 RepID=UPI00362B2B85
MAKLTREQFFQAIVPAVILVRGEGSPMFPSVRLAQSLLESGGEIPAWNNLGGVKVGAGKENAYWQGEAVVKGTWEYVDGRAVAAKAAFRAYKSIYHFYKDLDLLLNTPRYARVRQADTPERQAQMLQACGYATDPAYPSKLTSLIRQYGLKKYDEMGKPQPAPKGFEKASVVPIVYHGGVISKGYLLQGVTWIQAKATGEALGATIGWKGSRTTVNGVDVDTVLSSSAGFIKIRDFADVLSLKAGWDGLARVVMLE